MDLNKFFNWFRNKYGDTALSYLIEAYNSGMDITKHDSYKQWLSLGSPTESYKETYTPPAKQKTDVTGGKTTEAEVPIKWDWDDSRQVFINAETGEVRLPDWREENGMRVLYDPNGNIYSSAQNLLGDAETPSMWDQWAMINENDLARAQLSQGQQQWEAQMAWEKEKWAQQQAQAKREWLTELSKQPSEWIQYWNAKYGYDPSAPPWLKEYMGEGVERTWTQDIPQYISPETKTVKYPEWGTVQWGAGGGIVPEPIIGQGGTPMFVVRDDSGNIVNLVPLSEGLTGYQTKSRQEIAPQNVATPSGQWLNRAPATVKQGLAGYANWSAGQNKSMTWDDLMSNLAQMLPTSEPYKTRRWQPSKVKGW